MINAPIHDFENRLAYSERASAEPFWDAVYRKAFSNLVNHMQCSGNTESQRQGVDRVLHLANGKTLYVDEKKREKDYPDILLEYVSVDTTGAPGWIEKDLTIDYLAYAFMPTLRCYLMPWPILRLAWQRNKAEWMRQYKPVEAKNKTYTTYSLPVPLQVLFKSMWSVTRIDVSEELRDWKLN